MDFQVFPCFLFFVPGGTREKPEVMGLQMEGTSYRHERPQGVDNDPLHKVLPKPSVNCTQHLRSSTGTYEFTLSAFDLCLLRHGCGVSISPPN
jgi:hypothetical protein